MWKGVVGSEGFDCMESDRINDGLICNSRWKTPSEMWVDVWWQ